MPITIDDFLEIAAEAQHRFTTELMDAFREDLVEAFLIKAGMLDLILQTKELMYDTFPFGKLLIVGDSALDQKQIYGSLKSFGLDKDRVELCLDYKAVQKYPFTGLQYNPNYRLILFGPAPHSGYGKEKASSIITNLEQEPGYPKVIRLTDSHGLKITKNSLLSTVQGEIDSGYLAV